MAAATHSDAPDTDFRPALLVVDFQEDFCPPSGSLAVPGGRDISPVVNKLLTSPSFRIRIATRDWHPRDHISFASNHTADEENADINKNDGNGKRSNIIENKATKRPFVDTVRIANPNNPAEVVESSLWPVHCVQETPGAQLVPELDASRIDHVVDKGMDARVEMYSPFFDPFETTAAAATAGEGDNSATTNGTKTRGTVCDSGLADILAARKITDVYVVGLAADYCVRCAAVDAASLGYRTYVVEEGTRAVDAAAWEKDGRREIEGKGVKLVRMRDDEVTRLEGMDK